MNDLFLHSALFPVGKIVLISPLIVLSSHRNDRAIALLFVISIIDALCLSPPQYFSISLGHWNWGVKTLFFLALIALLKLSRDTIGLRFPRTIRE